MLLVLSELLLCCHLKLACRMQGRGCHCRFTLVHPPPLPSPPLSPACSLCPRSIDILGGQGWSYGAIPFIFIFMVLIRTGCMALFNLTAFRWIKEREWRLRRQGRQSLVAWHEMRHLCSSVCGGCTRDGTASSARPSGGDPDAWQAPWGTPLSPAACHASFGRPVVG